MIKNHKKKDKNRDGKRDKLNETSFSQTHKHEQKCYFCGSGTHMLNHCEIIDAIARYHWFLREINLNSHHQ